MTNGFYNSKTLDVKVKEEIIKFAISLAYCVRCEVKYKDDSNRRNIDPTASIYEFIEELITSDDNVLDIIDRNDYNQGKIRDTSDCGEVCWHSTYNKKSKREYWILLYCNLNLKNLKILTDKFKLTLIEY